MAGHANDTDDNSAIFWPGYVDAISNLVLNLLFLVMILCLAIFVQSQQSTQQHKLVPEGAASTLPNQTRLEEALPNKGSNLSNGGKTDTVQKRAEVEVRPSPEGKRPGAVRVQGQAVSEQGVYLEVHFLEDALELSDASRNALLEHLRPLYQQGYTQWELVVVTETAYASMRRSALMRILRVRELLSQSGVEGLSSKTRIDSGGDTSTTAVVRLYARRPGDAPITR